ncbi:hypothetical protein BAY61_31900 (plasmid) [Prauserella marina]|nr:hypothetical protein BAY61_31900 [Prauserella marina]
MDQRLARYAADLRELGAIRSPAVQKAFATVPRHRFLRSFYYRADRYTLAPGELPSARLLDVIYANNALFTHDGSDGDPTSSSSGPSVMAKMLEALDLRPGMRVLEIGGGTGYNAALLAAITGAEVTAVEAGRVAAANAGATIDELGLADRVRVVHADGYHGDPAGGRFDRIIATCGIAGVPPVWLDQLVEGGMLLAPIAHAGVHPILTVQTAGRVTVQGRCALWADFMPAAGNLRPSVLFAHDPNTSISADNVGRDVAAVPAAGPDRYNDLGFYLGVRDARTNRAYLDAPEFSPAAGSTALVEDDAAVWVQHNGDLLHAGPESTIAPLREQLHQLVHEWDSSGQPAATEWRARFAPASGTPAPLLVPSQWECADASPSAR